MKFELYTLVDITETRARRGEDPKLMRQQQNFLTVLQTIGLRVNPTYIKAPNVEKIVPSEVGLDNSYKNKQKVWNFIFDIEYEDALNVEMLTNDFNLVPVITNLDETVKFKNDVFISQNGKKNIVFYNIDDK
jgi:hypothetical protein